MQDMSCLISEPANSPPRVLRSDVSLEKSCTDTKDRKSKIMPKTLRNHHRESPIEKKKPSTVSKNCEDPKSSAEDTDSAGTSSEKNRKSQEILLKDTKNEKYTCKICDKVFSTIGASERHSLSHQNDKSFKCKMCDLTFSTNGAMHRHARTHKASQYSDSDDSAKDDSEGSGQSRHVGSETPRTSRKRRSEHNNNGSTDNSAEEESSTFKKRAKTINNNVISETKLSCPVCEREDFASLNVLETHMEEEHPDYQFKCVTCSLSFKNHRALNLHRFMTHHSDRDSTLKKLSANSVSGFGDCTFIDFSSQKFPEIAKTVCEKSVHKSVTEQTFRCKYCSRDFPCESALEIHANNCGSDDARSPADNQDWSGSCDTAENVRRDDFFANLDLQNKSPDSEQRRFSAEITKTKIQNSFRSPRDARNIIDSQKDLADIQSILSVTSTGSLLEQLTQKARDHMPKDQEPEEMQDVFAAEFRKMKLRGEFPCRLCTAIFPNLRALKGHNRVHLSGNGAGPYRCNMCPHSSLDKAALVRHMRTHNGDRPYECAVCNYAFTTKANCERHLRNRHSKITREDVKRSIIYHPSEDPNNDEMNSKLNISRDEIKRTPLYVSADVDHRDDAIDRIKNERSTPISHFPRDIVNFAEHALPIPIPRDLSIVIPQPRDVLKNHCLAEPTNDSALKTEEGCQPRIKVKGYSQLTQIPEFSESDNEKENYSDEDTEPAEDARPIKPAIYSTETPMDLSTGECQDDVLDLSKKRDSRSDDRPSMDSDQDEYLPKTLEFNNNTAIAASVLEKTQQLLFARQQQLMKFPKLDPTANFYATQLSQLYQRAGVPFSGLGLPPAFPLNPYFLQPNPFLAAAGNPQNVAEMNERIQKEIIRGLQLSGGGLVGVETNKLVSNMVLANERFQALQQQHQAMNGIGGADLKSHAPTSIVKTEDDVESQQLHVSVDPPTVAPYAPVASSPAIASPKAQRKETTSNQSPNSVKMVIKNGVLMPKQKQRRYRTERPFSCEHCSARFTLRSNMERHIKQQHPQYWSQRQRSSIGSVPRKNPISMVPQSMAVPQGISLNYDARFGYLKSVHGETGTDAQESDRKDGSPARASSINRSPISDHVKYAILAQQLKSQNPSSHSDDLKNRMETIANGDNEEEDEEDALIIDEETVDDGSQPSGQLQPKRAAEASRDQNLLAKRVARDILTAARSQHDVSKDFDWKIAGNLINKNLANRNADIPTFVSQIGSDGAEESRANDGAAKNSKSEEGDLVSVSKLLDNATSQNPFGKYFKDDFSKGAEAPRKEIGPPGEGSEEDEEGLVASGSASEGNNSGSDENKSESEAAVQAPQKKKSAYSLAPNRVSCPYCHRKFPWSSSLRRHILTHTGQKPYKCPHCPLLFTTKSNCDRHLLRKHGTGAQQTLQNSSAVVADPAAGVPIPELGNQGFMMRNVPERPYKCANCPSSTFSTLSNLKKHMTSKHGVDLDSQPDSPGAEGTGSRRESCENDRALASDDEKSPKRNDAETERHDGHGGDWEAQISSSKCSPSHPHDAPSNVQNSDLPFKCHLCEGSYAERQAALDHIRESHESEYELLVCKGALETGINLGDDLGLSGHRSEGAEDQGSEENIESLRGKFPDYANRKVVCAFCMRRFWSAEDLRRHMRTHTGERPFSCDVCRRRFTLKHSMLRHRKKHSTPDRSGEDFTAGSGDEDAPSPAARGNGGASPSSNAYHSHPNASTPASKASRLSVLNAYQIAIHAKNLSASPEIPSNVNNNNSPPALTYDGKLKPLGRRDLKSGHRTRYSSEDNDAQESEVESGGDLIGNLLGISDKGMINKLLSSPDEAAKLLGVNK